MTREIWGVGGRLQPSQAVPIPSRKREVANSCLSIGCSGVTWLACSAPFQSNWGRLWFALRNFSAFFVLSRFGASLGRKRSDFGSPKSEDSSAYARNERFLSLVLRLRKISLITSGRTPLMGNVRNDECVAGAAELHERAGCVDRYSRRWEFLQSKISA
jgi:hypothetical protein